MASECVNTGECSFDSFRLFSVSGQYISAPWFLWPTVEVSGDLKAAANLLNALTAGLQRHGPEYLSSGKRVAAFQYGFVLKTRHNKILSEQKQKS